MFTPATDYNQQLLAYLQMLRQLLDQLTAMVAAGTAFPTAPFAMPSAPFMPPGGQFMPPSMPPSTSSAPPTPPAPADYAQQLFGYLQAWRQYLEQMAGASPGSGSDNPPQAPDGPSGPGNDTGGESAAPSGAARGSGQTLPPPKLVNIAPSNPVGSQVTEITPGLAIPSLVDVAPTGDYVSQISGPGFGPGGSFDQGAYEPQVLNPPGNELGTFMPPPPPILIQTPVAQRPSGVVAPGILAQHSAGSSFQSAIDRLDLTSVQEVAPKSLFSAPQAPSNG